MSGNHHHGEMPFKCFRCCIAKKGRKEGGEREGVRGGEVGDHLESPVKTHSIFLVFFFFFLSLLLFFTVCGMGGKLLT